MDSSVMTLEGLIFWLSLLAAILVVLVAGIRRW